MIEDMTDRELLELAAKAAGIHLHHWFDGHRVFMCSSVEGGDPDHGWNPLTDDGDALRLACRLGIDIFPWQDKSHDERTVGIEAATRKAVVIAAAEIGKQSNTALTGRAHEEPTE